MSRPATIALDGAADGRSDALRSAEEVESALSEAGIDASARPETLAVSDFIRLARAFG